MRREALAREHAQLIARALREAEPGVPMRDTRASLPGDTRAMRGTPIQMRGVPGTLPGSDPMGELLRKHGDWSGRE